MNRNRTIFVALIFLTVITACVIPGFQTATAPTFAPTVDTSRLETMVAETVSAAISQTEQARPTSTATPRPTRTAVPTLEASATPTAATIPSGSTLTVQADGSTIFVDEYAKFEITAPAAWLVMRVTEQEYLDVWQLAEAADENIQQALFSVQNENPNILRLYAIDAQEGHIQNGFVTNMKFIRDEKNPMALETDQALKASANELVKATAGSELISAAIIKVNEIPVGVIEMKYTIKNAAGESVTVYQKQAIFNAGTGKMVITLATTEALKDVNLPVFDAMLNTLKLSAQ